MCVEGEICPNLLRSYFNCSIPELFELWISAKIQLNDLIGLLEITKAAYKRMNRKEYAYLHLETYGKLAELARATNNIEKCRDYYIDGCKQIDEFINDEDKIMYNNPTTKINLNQFLISFSDATDKPDDF
ncbi:MAG: hypothetical protein BWK80_29660 [Desulfobacteraceae bacterium IS3]|nr:MAG: hypothetical protein BWK80_29660 [Desulfobacteraceae bacterium IS3]